MGYNDPKIKLETEFGNQGDLCAKNMVFDTNGVLRNLGGLFWGANGNFSVIETADGIDLFLQTNNSNNSAIYIGKAGGNLSFNGVAAVPKPIIDHAATSQSIVDALVALGLCSQAAS